MAIFDEKSQIKKAMKCAAAMATNHTVVIGDTSTSNQVKAPTAATDVPVGVISTTAATAGDLVDVVLFGIAKVKCGASITRFSALQIKDTTGEVKTLVATGYFVGIALESGSDHDIIEAFICPLAGIPKA